MNPVLQVILTIMAALWLLFTLAGIVLVFIAVYQRAKTESEIDDFVKEMREQPEYDKDCAD